MKILLENLKGNKTDKLPIWFMRQAGRHLPEYLELRSKAPNFMEFCYNPKMAAEATLQPVNRYDIDGAILFSDILVIPQALGQDVSFVKGQGPQLAELNMKSLNTENVVDRLSPVIETIHQVKDGLRDGVTFLGFCGAPWTVATYMVQQKGMRDSANARQYAYSHPEDFKALLDIIVESSVEYLSAQIEAGVDAVQIFDSWAGALDEQAFADFAIKPVVKMVKKLKAKHPETPIIGFPRGGGILTKDFIEQTKVDAISLDQSTPVRWAAKHLQSQVCVQGNLDNQRIVAGGAEMEKAIDNILTHWANGPMVFNLNHGFTPETPIKNVEAVIERVHNFKRS
ncbi:MAG: uroporphyrinogen decarboxylase [Alphaproteobacteria bacterium]